ncbi:MAG: hypothetical protein ACJAYC_002704 [Halieaceae bacterium]
MKFYWLSDESSPRSKIASVLIISCLLAVACLRPVNASPCKYSTSWLQLNNQGVTDCELLAIEKALSLKEKNFNLLYPALLRAGHIIDEEAEDEFIPYFALAILNTPEQHPFDGRLQLQVECKSMDGKNWECETLSESPIVYHRGKAILVSGTSEKEALTVAKAFDSTPVEALIEILEDDLYKSLAPMLKEIGWPETLQDIYGISKDDDSYNLYFGGLECVSTTIRVKRTYCGDPSCELDLQSQSWLMC